MVEPGGEIDVSKWAPLCSSTLRSLHPIWDEMGLSSEERLRQVASISEQVERVFSRKLEDEKALVKEYRRLALALEDEINNMQKHILGLVPEDSADIEVPETTSLTEKLTWLRTEKEKLDAIKSERLETIETMQSKLLEMWGELGEEPAEEFAQVGEKITMQRIEEFEAHLIVVGQQRDNRIIALRSACQDISVLFTELEFTPETAIDHAIVKNSRKNTNPEVNELVDLSLTMDTVQLVSQRARELTEEKISRTERIKQLGSQIQPLWELLEVTEEYRTEFFSDNRGLGMAVIKQCEVELQRLLCLKKTKMQELVENARSRIDELLTQIGRNPNTPRDTYHELLERTVYDDETLQAHEEVVRILSEQYEVLAPIEKLVDKYKFLIQDREDYEKKIQDSSRLLSRKRGSLREEELQRKRVTVQLPKLIKHLKSSILSYEESYGEFVVDGKSFIKTMQETETDHEQKLAFEKAARHTAKKGQTPRKQHGTPRRKVRTPSRYNNSSMKENVIRQ